MRYLLAIILPPVAVLLCGKPFRAALNACLLLCILTPGLFFYPRLYLWGAAIVHALQVVWRHRAIGPASPGIILSRVPPRSTG